MKRKILFEFLYLIFISLSAVVLMAFCTVIKDSKNTFGFKVFENSIQMSVGLMLLFFWLITVFIFNLLRQLKLKFNQYFSNLSIIISGLVLEYFLNVFVSTTINMKEILEREKLYEKVKNCDYEIILFRSLQILVGVIIVVAIVKTIKKLRVHSA